MDPVHVNDITELDTAPVPCALLVGDDASGRRMVTSQDFDRFWSGPLAGSLTELDVDVETPARLLSRGMAGDRFIVASGPEDDSTVSLIDATTGEVVGSIPDLFVAFPARAISPDGETIAIGSAVPNRSAGEGITHVIDAETGTELFTVDTPTPAPAVAFDGSTGELLLAAAGGSLVTVDPSGEIVSEVDFDGGSGIHAVGLHPDGSVLNAVDGRIRPDGTALLWDGNNQAHVVDPAVG